MKRKHSQSNEQGSAEESDSSSGSESTSSSDGPDITSPELTEEEDDGKQCEALVAAGSQAPCAVATEALQPEQESEYEWQPDPSAVGEDIDHLTKGLTAAYNAFGDLKKRNSKTGPSEYKELFQWPERYVGILLNHPEFGAAARNNFSLLRGFNVEHNEGFAGTGSAGIALHMIWKALQSATKSDDTGLQT